MLIKLFQTDNPNYGYNIQKGGNNKKLSEETLTEIETTIYFSLTKLFLFFIIFPHTSYFSIKYFCFSFNFSKGSNISTKLFDLLIIKSGITLFILFCSSLTLSIKVIISFSNSCFLSLEYLLIFLFLFLS